MGLVVCEERVVRVIRFSICRGLGEVEDRFNIVVDSDIVGIEFIVVVVGSSIRVVDVRINGSDIVVEDGLIVVVVGVDNVGKVGVVNGLDEGYIGIVGEDGFFNGFKSVVVSGSDGVVLIIIVISWNEVIRDSKFNRVNGIVVDNVGIVIEDVSGG